MCSRLVTNTRQAPVCVFLRDARRSCRRSRCRSRRRFMPPLLPPLSLPLPPLASRPCRRHRRLFFHCCSFLRLIVVFFAAVAVAATTVAMPHVTTPCEELTKIVLKEMFCFCCKCPFEVLFRLPPQNSTSNQYQNNLQQNGPQFGQSRLL